ncbi:serine hydrolase domain-containing protein [Saccharibacillus sp. CPCC 101409]|nr:serine hydrolase domain-containing protein [Saccharibacillus sp. CPCC 101409]MDO3408142.1 serine hydrolase domain-containing protein [Saccharibacillus sp. CPCC 101409]
MSSQLFESAELLDRIERSGLEVNSLILLRGGEKVLEFYREPYRRGAAQLLYSLSKSFTSIAVGIARDLGLLRLDDPVISFFPDKLPAQIPPNLYAMTVHHLLCMNAGHDRDIYPLVVRETDWAEHFWRSRSSMNRARITATARLRPICCPRSSSACRA